MILNIEKYIVLRYFRNGILIVANYGINNIELVSVQKIIDWGIDILLFLNIWSSYRTYCK